MSSGKTRLNNPHDWDFEDVLLRADNAHGCLEEKIVLSPVDQDNDAVADGILYIFQSKSILQQSNP